MRILIISIFIFLSYAESFAQIDRYVVYFTDKLNSTYTITQPEQFLSLRSIARRSKLGIPLIEDDLPVNQNYINDVELTGAQAFYSSKWLNAVLIQATAAQKDQVLLLPFVSRIEFVAPSNPLIKGARTTINTNKFQITTDSTFAQNDLIGTSFMNADGINGMGILIGNFDAGFPGVNTISSFSKIFPQNILDSYNYVSNNANVYTAHPHGTNTLSILGAEIDGEFYGIATGAKYLLYITEDIASEYRIEEYNWLFAAERADSIGVDIITSSLGYYTFDDKSMDYSKTDLNGKTAIITKAANKAIEKGIVVVTSAGNEGNNSWGKITFPGDCFGCVVVGNVNYEGIRNLSSSFGPTEDGRIKPDVMAMGTSISVINPDNTIKKSGGTSFSAPQIAGLIAGLMQKFPDLTPTEIIQIMKESASQATNPDSNYGFGIPHYNAINKWAKGWDQLQFTAYPTLVDSNILFFETDNPSLTPEVTFILYNAKGQMLFNNKIHFSWSVLKVEKNINVAEGLYFLKIILSDQKVITQKIMVR